MGLYAPSAGTIYPRLARLEAEGLVTSRQEGDRRVYQLTSAGRAELARRREELAALEAEVRTSAAELAREIREDVRGTARDLDRDLKQAARELRRQRRYQGRARQSPGDALDAAREARDEVRDSMKELKRAARELLLRPRARRRETPAQALGRHLEEFTGEARALAQRASPTDAQLAECAAILADALARLRRALGEPG